MWNEPLSARIQAIDLHTWSIDASSNIMSETITTSKHWLDANDSVSLGFDSDVPNFDPSWLVDVAQAHTTDFTVRADDGFIGYATTKTQKH
jgi:hypothetical protein